MVSAAMKFTREYTAQPVNPLNFREIQNMIFFSPVTDHGDSSRSAAAKERTRSRQALRRFKKLSWKESQN